jgi:hypothetical protein
MNDEAEGFAAAAPRGLVGTATVSVSMSAS